MNSRQWQTVEPYTPPTLQQRIESFGVETVISHTTRTIDTRIAYGDAETDSSGMVVNYASRRHRMLTLIVKHWNREKGGDCLTLVNADGIAEMDTARQNESGRRQIYWALFSEHRT